MARLADYQGSQKGDRELVGLISNFDDDPLAGLGHFEDLIRDCPDRLLDHSAWDHYGYIWFVGDGFLQEVWQHGRPIAWHVHKTLAELVREVNDAWGWD